ncbi:MAG: hypothetical protein NZ524_02185 [Thiobacillaceae bacterium]|nr:hypothetical protein [Thiobacillaceae bacterium]MDW8322557.1 hypothetical protein [Burkholderiales bacterium]
MTTWRCCEAGALVAGLLLAGWATAGATGQELSAHIQSGAWELTSMRQAYLRPLGWRHREQTHSRVCIGDDPLRQLREWIERKGCRILSEEAFDGGYLLRGECRLRWLPAAAVPSEVRLTWRGKAVFDIDIVSLSNRWLDYAEHTRADHVGSCQ